MGELIITIPIPERMADTFSGIVAERQRQNEKWDNHHLISDKTWLMIMVEEVGEVAMAMQGDGDLREELIQVAAVAAAWVENMDRRTL